MLLAGNVDVAITSIGLLGLHVPLSCATVTAVALAIASPVLSTTTYLYGQSTIPSIHCGGFLGSFFGPVLTAILSGPENAYFTLKIAPPASTTTSTATTTS